ncbi:MULTISPECIES: sensor domain-containing diguanylate cyclase [unclassified Caballeronia]|uniref:sensor domain-containing diguanylate cyclase n=1 Tax=unclassified Caballeronia TaxID=2646786 RepID=UPI00285506D7|nr:MULTISPECIES: sensor domain-containing diguanylate cyclase [unclassified Caballeronia]MDR5777563.1 sensor domain-containing diguanylate cyclase [Caballeronia sp. LZ002]MDR5852986.1 sensor domain-containing diguanylate cyclase [Caballeronia sp. LZ003]
MPFSADSPPDTRLASRLIGDGPQGSEPSAIEWLLYDDQVMRECFRHAAAILKCVTGASIIAITLLDRNLQHYFAAGGVMMSPMPRGRSLCDHAVQGDKLFVTEDARSDTALQKCALVHGAPFIRFYAAIAIRAPGGEAVGVLCAMDSSPRQLDPDARDVFHHLRALIENDLRLRTAAALDPLTRLFNRRFMREYVRRQWQDAGAGEHIGLVVIDVDWFKHFNDTYGHPAGDGCLREVSSVLQMIADEHQMIAGPIGGEEFALLVTATEPHRSNKRSNAYAWGSSVYRLPIVSGGLELSR